MKTRHIPLLLLLAGLFVLTPACSSDDDDNGGTAPIIPAYDDPVLEAMATEGVEVVEGIVEMAPELFSGQMGLKDTTTPVWDPTCTCWRWTVFEGDATNPMDTWSRNWILALTYYQGETPQMEFEGADRIGVEIQYNFNHSMSSDLGSDYEWFAFTLETSIVPNGPESIMVSGYGSGNLGAESYSGEDYEDFDQEFTISLNLTMPAMGGCPGGGLDLDMDTKSFSVGFDGSTTGYWDYITGPGQSLQGELTITCGK
jgi:hypothetical protein